MKRILPVFLALAIAISAAAFAAGASVAASQAVVQAATDSAAIAAAQVVSNPMAVAWAVSDTGSRDDQKARKAVAGNIARQVLDRALGAGRYTMDLDFQTGTLSLRVTAAAPLRLARIVLSERGGVVQAMAQAPVRTDAITSLQ